MVYRILKNGAEVNRIVSDEAFVTDYCAKNGYTFEEEAPPPTPEPEPDPEPTVEERLDSLEDALAQTDETAIELYEANEEQQSINTAQDEALIEIYEMIGG